LESSSSPSREAARAFFTLSGEHPSLPAAEVKALLEAQGVKWRLLDEGPFYVRVEAPIEAAVKAAERAAMTMECCLELASCPAVLDEAVRAARQVEWPSLDSGSFAVRAERRIPGPRAASSLELERAIGAVVKEAWPSARVDLRRPDVVVRGFVVGDRLLLGLRLVKVDRGRFGERRPRRRPFFHPSALDPKLARLYVNLARAWAGDVVLDPFTGTGSILVEAWMLGCLPVGFDLDPFMVKGAARNLEALGAQALLAVGDARRLAARSVDCVATDPPYGRASSTHGLGYLELLSEFLSSTAEALKRGRYACFAAPSWIEVEEVASTVGLEVVECHDLRVHRSLTRRIVVARR